METMWSPQVICCNIRLTHWHRRQKNESSFLKKIFWFNTEDICNRIVCRCVSRDLVNDINLDEIMAWCHNSGCVIKQIKIRLRIQEAVNSMRPGNSIRHHASWLTLAQVMNEWQILRWTPQDLIDDKSTLVQVMAWCRQATSHYLN